MGESVTPAWARLARRRLLRKPDMVPVHGLVPGPGIIQGLLPAIWDGRAVLQMG